MMESAAVRTEPEAAVEERGDHELAVRKSHKSLSGRRTGRRTR